MAASDILNIWNNALGNLGAKTSIASLTEQSAEAAACALNYPTLINRMTRETNWSCLRRTLALTDVTSTFAAPSRWAYRYSFPSKCQRIWTMQNPSGILWVWPSSTQGFELVMDPDPGNSNIPTRYICSNWQNLEAIYTEYQFDSTNGYYEAIFDSSLVDCASWGLAAEIAGTLTGNAQLIAATSRMAKEVLDEARAALANESAPNSVNIPAAESLRVRGASFYPNLPPNFAYLSDFWDW